MEATVITMLAGAVATLWGFVVYLFRRVYDEKVRELSAHKAESAQRIAELRAEAREAVSLWQAKAERYEQLALSTTTLAQAMTSLVQAEQGERQGGRRSP